MGTAATLPRRLRRGVIDKRQKILDGRLSRQGRPSPLPPRGRPRFERKRERERERERETNEMTRALGFAHFQQLIISVPTA